MKSEKENLYLFDPLRKKRVVATPEEIVRQKMILYLNEKLGWPLPLMNSEVEIDNRFRCDIVCFSKNGETQLIVECKAPNVKITQKTFDQIWHYAVIMKSRWIIVTNGEKSYCCKWNPDSKNFNFIETFPHYNGGEISEG